MAGMDQVAVYPGWDLKFEPQCGSRYGSVLEQACPREIWWCVLWDPLLPDPWVLSGPLQLDHCGGTSLENSRNSGGQTWFIEDLLRACHRLSAPINCVVPLAHLHSEAFGDSCP